MALQSFSNNFGTLIIPNPCLPVNPGTGNQTIDAAGESIGFIGRLHLPGGPGSSKTISSAGGKIYFKTGAVTWADAGTTLRVGINDVAATGVEDGTHDVYADLVPGTETVGANAINQATMETGSKTIAHGDEIAVVIEMTARGGTDSVVVHRYNTSSQYPYYTGDTGSGPVASGSLPCVTIEFDDGTIGFLGASSFVSILTSTNNFHLNSTPDEYGLIFRLPFKARILGFNIDMGSVASSDDYEICFYSDPLGTPSLIEAITVDATFIGGAGGICQRQLASYYTASINTDYAVTIRPTTTGSLSIDVFDFGSGNSNLRKPTMLGTDWSLISRTNNAGAFSQDTEKLPKIGVFINQLDDGVSSGGGGTHAFPFAG